jgi:hypothetical protein
MNKAQSIRQSENTKCELCANPQAAKLNQHWMTGIVLMRTHYSFHKTVCEKCAHKVMLHAFKHNATKGWWSVYAIFINPVLIIVVNPLMYWAFQRRFSKLPQLSTNKMGAVS